MSHFTQYLRSQDFNSARQRVNYCRDCGYNEKVLYILIDKPAIADKLVHKCATQPSKSMSSDKVNKISLLVLLVLTMSL